MQQTTYYQLSEQDYGENPDVALINGNMDVIDTALNKARIRDTDLYNENSTYAIGDFCIYNDALYRCTGATTGVFDPTKWTLTTIAEAFEPKHRWEVYDTITADGTKSIIQESFSVPVRGVFVEVKLETVATNAQFGVVVQFNNSNHTRRSIGDLTAAIQSSVRYLNARYEADGNFWQGWISNPTGQYEYGSLNARVDSFFVTDSEIELIEFRTQTSGALIPSGSTMKIYVRR